MAKGLNYEKMKRNDFAKSSPDFYTTRQAAVIGKSDSGAIKVSFRGDQPVDVAIKAIHAAIKEAGYGIMGNPVIYFYPTGKEQPKKKQQQGRVDSWEPRPTVAPFNGKLDAGIDDGSLPWD